MTLDFGRPILLTDVLIPTCGDLASLSIDIWTLGEEVDGRRLVVATDISTHSLILHDLLPPPVCRFMKVRGDVLHTVSFKLLTVISMWISLKSSSDLTSVDCMLFYELFTLDLFSLF